MVIDLRVTQSRSGDSKCDLAIMFVFSLDVANHVRDCQRGRQSSKNVNVIFDTTDLDCVAFLCAKSSTDVFVEPLLNILIDGSFSISSCEDDVKRVKLPMP